MAYNKLASRTKVQRERKQTKECKSIFCHFGGLIFDEPSSPMRNFIQLETKGRLSKMETKGSGCELILDVSVTSLTNLLNQ